MRCDACGATNADSADWCSQCYASVQLRPEPSSTGGSSAASDTAGGASDDERSGDPMVEGFRRRGDTVEWQCPACAEWNRVEDMACRVCATSVFARWQHSDAGDLAPAAERFTEPWTAALALSAVIPGAGHIGLRRYGSGIARALLFGVWLVGGVALLVSAGGVAAGPLLLGAGLLWALSLADVAALRAGRREILGGRALVWLVVGVLGLSALSVLVAAAQARPAG